MNQPLLARPVPQLDPVHDGRHRLRDLPLERESIPYVISLPEHGLAAAIYTRVSKNHLGGALLGLLGPAVGDTPIFEAVDGIAMSPDRDFDDWHVGPVHLSQDLRMQTSRLKATSARAQLDVVFEALHPAYADGFDPDGCPAYAATNRIEQAGRVQAGRVRGTLVWTESPTSWTPPARGCTRSRATPACTFTHFPVVPVPTCTLLEGAMRCEIDGKAGSGWTEFMWPTAYLDYLKSRQS